jgi:3-oxoacyl-(acyl-carrier-protein) synthase
MTPRAITGLGIASTIGVGKEAFYAGLRTPPAIADRAPLISFDPSKYGGDGQLAQVLEVPNFDPAKYLGDKGLRTLDRLTKLLVVAARLALHDAGLKKDNHYIESSPERVGLCCSNAYGSLEAITELDRVAKLEDARYINPAKFPNTVSNSASGYVSIWEDLRALNVAVSDGNCGGLDAVACADVYFETGRADAILVGGGEAMSEALFLAFHKLGALSPRALLGEGAALFSLEPLDLAQERGAPVLALVTGYGTSFVAPDTEGGLIHPSAEAMERAIKSALAEAGIGPEDVDICASSLSGLKAFDARELAAIGKAIGPDACLAQPKALLGETLGAGGAMGMATALAWLQGVSPCTEVLRTPANPNPQPARVPAKLDTVLVTTMGYYGNASAVVMRRAP